MQKSERQSTIRNIISSRPISRQDELVRLLRRSGHSVTQASVSRDLDELGIVKVGGNYSLPSMEKQSSAFGTLSFETSGDSLIVIKCDPGFASAAASRIDHLTLADVVGTIAGDDTIFVAVKNGESQRPVLRSLLKLFGE